FQTFNEKYAVGPRQGKPGDVPLLCGAGLTVRKSALLELEKNGFQTRLVGRQGTALMSNEDSELCLALSLAGWRLWYEPRLRFRHFVPASRLEWSYLRRLVRGTGLSSPGLDPYFCAMKPRRTGAIRLLRKVRE